MTPSSGRVYATRQRSRRADAETRYDDIFSAVTRAVQDEGAFGGLSRRLIEENSMPVRMRLFSQSSHETTDDDEEEEDESSETDGSQVVATSPSGRPQRRAALVARATFEAVETIEEATDDAFDSLLASHAAVFAARDAKAKAKEDAMKMVRRVEMERKRRESERQRRGTHWMSIEKTTTKQSSQFKAGHRFECTQCPMFYERHLQLHKHIYENHTGTGCSSCKQPWRVLRQRHECFKCSKFAVNVDKHLIEAHYAVSSRRGALLECSRCSRTFEHLKEVVAHERAAHGLVNKSGAARKMVTHCVQQKRPQFHCRVCGDAFNSRYLRDQHLTKHFQSVIESVWLTIEKMQEDSPESFLLNQCPLCGFVMSSRKSFRTHIIHRHLMYDGNALETLVGPGVKQEELLTVREHIALEGRKTIGEVEMPAVPKMENIVKEEDVEEKKITYSDDPIIE
ncbi:hypothetical protein PFISCL1PPCAC_12435 [Pristionchus fissidentatus]|uniref:C2H2-type domain-containing protein n=1 Tax=Pristionchus fissidentatus TaxID=1538716 RepID=A0AAV5VNX8_9BILA|nr:hypothetical protein PFISCL1PPCAC_12435 [Pristionchus fissidentatus]